MTVLTRVPTIFAQRRQQHAGQGNRTFNRNMTPKIKRAYKWRASRQSANPLTYDRDQFKFPMLEEDLASQRSDNKHISTISQNSNPQNHKRSIVTAPTVFLPFQA